MDQRYSKDENLKHLSKWFTNCLRSTKNTFQDIAEFLKMASTVQHKDSLKANENSTKNNKSKNEANVCERLL